MRAIDAEIQRTEDSGLSDIEDIHIECSCGTLLVGGNPNSATHAYLYRTCAECWAADHYEPDTLARAVGDDSPDLGDLDWMTEPAF